MENSVEILMVILVKLNIVFTNQKNDKTSFYLIYYFPQKCMSKLCPAESFFISSFMKNDSTVFLLNILLL